MLDQQPAGDIEDEPLAVGDFALFGRQSHRGKLLTSRQKRQGRLRFFGSDSRNKASRGVRASPGLRAQVSAREWLASYRRSGLVSPVSAGHI